MAAAPALIRRLHRAPIRWAVGVVLCLGTLGASAQQEVSQADLERTVARVVGAGDAPEVRVELGLACLTTLAESPDPKLEKEVRLALGIALSAQERFGEAWDHLEVGARLAREAPDDTSLAHCLWLRAVAGFHLGRLEDAVEAATEGMDAAASAGWDDALWRMANILGLAEERRGDSEAALEAYSRGQEVAERVAQQSGNTEGVYVLLGNIGIAYMNLGELDLALEIFERAVEMQLESPNPTGLHSALANVGDVLILMDRLEEAHGYHLEALELRRELGSEAELALSYYSLGAIHLGSGEFEAALAEFEKALEIRRRLQLAPETAATLSLMAQAYAALDRDDEALDNAKSGLALTDQLEMKGRRVAILESLGTVHEELGDHATAIEVFRQATELERQQRSLETRRRLAEFRAEFETREKEQQIALLSRETELQELALSKRRFERNALLVGVLFVTVAAIAGWFAWASLRQAMKRIQSLEQDRIRADKLESIGVLAGGIAHDFNNILHVVVGNLSLLRLDQDDEAARKLLGNVEQALGQGNELSTQLLTFAKGGVLARELQALEPLLRQATGLALSGSRSKAELSIEPDLWCASVDAGQLRQLFANVVLNADQAMPQGGIIGVRAENVDLSPGEHGALSAGPYVRVTIVDQGTGIDRAVEDKIFDPYFTTKEEGSGLGLALAYAIVGRHQGAIDYRPNPGGGSAFEILIPAVPDARQSPSPAEETIRMGVGRVLVMDDDPLIRDLYHSSLVELGYECELAEDGRAAVDRFDQALRESRPFRVVILDLTIPGGMGGLETLKQLLDRDPDVRAIVASGYSDDQLLENYRAAGFVGALAKPFTFAALSQAVELAARRNVSIGADGADSGGTVATVTTATTATTANRNASDA